MVGASHNSVAMVEGEMDEVSESEMIEAIKIAHEAIKIQCTAQLELAKKLGIDPEVVIDVFNSGNARSFISESRFPNHILSEKWDARSRVSNLFKDLSMVTNLLNDNEIGCPYGELTTDILKNAVSEGLADVDFSLLYNEYEKLIDK